MKRLLFTLFASLVLVSAESNGSIVNVMGAEWQQPADFTDLSHEDIAATCNQSTGECSGVLNGVDLTGWTWASSSDMGELFTFLTNGLHPGGRALVAEFDSDWAPLVFDSIGFLTTAEGSSHRAVRGWTRDIFGNQVGDKAQIFDRLDSVIPDEAWNERGDWVGYRETYTGGWFYRAVPVPAAFWLFASGLLALGILRRANVAH